ncbi:MAG: glycosyltransferase [Actinomycetota bacterium]
MIRLLHLLPVLGVGGTEVVVLDLCKHRDRSRFECAVAVQAEGAEIIADEFRALDVPVHLGRDACRNALRWADFVNLHWYYFSAGFLRLAQEAQKPFVTTLHCNIALPPIPAVTICTADHTYRAQTHAARCVSIPNGVDVGRYAPREPSTRAEVVVTRVCRPPKCAPYFWDAMRLVLDRHPQARLRIAGNPAPCRYPSNRVEFLGVRRDIPELLADTDIFAYAPYPALGSKDLVVMEAAAAGVPSVVSDVEAVRESVEDGRTGFLVPFGNARRMAEAVGLLIENPDLRTTMGAAARELMHSRFDMQHITRRYEAVYEEVLAANRLTAVAPASESQVPEMNAEPTPAMETRHAWSAQLTRWWPEALIARPRRHGSVIRCGILTPSLYLGGAERWILDLLAATDREQIRWNGVALTCPTQSVPETLSAVRATCPVFPGKTATEALARACDVLVIWGIPHWWEWLSADAQCRIVLVSHGSGAWTEAVFRSSQRADQLVGVSHVALTPIPEGERSRSHLIYNGIDASRVTPRQTREEIRTGWGVAAEQRVLGFMGRLSGEKNPEALVEGVSYLPDEWVGVAVGQGHLLGALETLAAERCPGRIRFPGYTLDVGGALAGFDVLLSPAHEEGFCYSVLKGCLARRPVISTPTGISLEHPELVRPIPLAPTGAQVAAAVLDDAAAPDQVAARVRAAHHTAVNRFSRESFGARWTELLASTAQRGAEADRAPLRATL